MKKIFEKKTFILCFYLTISSLTFLSFNIHADKPLINFTKKYIESENNKKDGRIYSINYQNNFEAYILKGTVIDSTTNDPIVGASVLINRKKTTVTNSEGYFEFILPSKYMNANFKIIVSSIGFRDKKIKIKNKEQTLTLPLKICLEESKADLDKTITTCCY